MSCEAAMGCAVFFKSGFESKAVPLWGTLRYPLRPGSDANSLRSDDPIADPQVQEGLPCTTEMGRVLRRENATRSLTKNSAWAFRCATFCISWRSICLRKSRSSRWSPTPSTTKRSRCFSCKTNCSEISIKIYRTLVILTL